RHSSDQRRAGARPGGGHSFGAGQRHRQASGRGGAGAAHGHHRRAEEGLRRAGGGRVAWPRPRHRHGPAPRPARLDVLRGRRGVLVGTSWGGGGAMVVTRFDRASRYGAKLDPVGFLRWLLGEATLLFRRWLDTRSLPFPGEPDRTCDTVACVVEAGVPGILW